MIERFSLDCRIGIGFGFGFGFTTSFGWLVYLLWSWFYDSQVKTALIIITTRRKQEQEQGATSNLSCTWLKKGELKKESEGLLTAAQEQALRTNAIKAKIDKQGCQLKMQVVQESGRISKPHSL